jgi:glutathione synthase/RimK-type ligase-like ATP-grasp enzyme
MCAKPDDAMPDATEIIYHAKKWYALFPGVIRPVSGSFLADHYARRAMGRGPLRMVVDAAIGLGFHAWIPWRARAVRRRFGLSPEWQRRAIAMGRARFADPNDLALFRIEHADALDGYIRRFEDAALNKVINPLGWTRDCALADKALFYERCEVAELPHPATIAVGNASGWMVHRQPIPGHDLLIKPARGEGGRGVAFLDPPGEDIEAWLATTFGGRSGNWIIQERITTHALLRNLALGALSTARITTILNEHGVPEPVSAVLRLASDPKAQVDNMKAGGLLAPVDLVTGVLGIACKGYGGGDYAQHPATGAGIEGRMVPWWQEAKQLAVEAHRSAFSDYALVGWDIGICDQGAILIEGNAKPGVLMPQRASRRGLGGQRYGELLGYHLARVGTAQRK